MRIELMIPSLQEKCSTTEPKELGSHLPIQESERIKKTLPQNFNLFIHLWTKSGKFIRTRIL